MRRHAGNELERCPGRVVDVQGAALERHFDKSCRNARAFKMRSRLLNVDAVEDPKPYALAAGLATGRLQGKAVMASLLDAVQAKRRVVLRADFESDHLGVERLAGGKIANCEHEMARTRDVERRIEIGLRVGQRNLTT
jgi:hypothetical protein